MDQTQLSTGTGGSPQSQTISPGSLAQPAPEGNPGGTPIGQVQPSVTGTSLGPQSGVALNTTVLPNVKLNLANSTVAASAPASSGQPVKPHHVQPLFIVLPVLLVVVALVSIWQASRAAKSTTNY